MNSVDQSPSTRELTSEELDLVSGGLTVGAGLGVAVTDLLGVSAGVTTQAGVNVGGPLGGLLSGAGLNNLLGGLLGGL